MKMESISKYLDNVKTKPELKVKTRRYIEEKITARRRLRRLAFAVCAMLAVCVLSVGGYAYYQTPVGYVSLDINPSVELGVNAFNRVVSARAINADGEIILDCLSLKNKPVGEAIGELVGKAIDCELISDDGSSVVALTAQSRNEEKAEELKELCVSEADRALSDANAYAAVLGGSSDFSLRDGAQELGISPGKYKLITMLKVLDPAINIEDYTGEKVGDIMEKAKELADSADYGEGNTNGEIGKILGAIAQYSDKSGQAHENANNNSGDNGNMSTERNSDTTQNTETNRYTEQNGSTNEYNGSNGSSNSSNNSSNGSSNNNNNSNNAGSGQSNSSSGSTEREPGASSGPQPASSNDPANGQNGQGSEPPAYGSGNANTTSKKG